MHITKEFQIILPREIIENMNIIPEKTNIEFLQDSNARWYLSKVFTPKKETSRFRTAYLAL